MFGKKKPRIAFLNHWAYPLGGAEYSLLDLLSIANKQFDCHLLTSGKGILIDKAKRVNSTCHIIPCTPFINKIRRTRMVKSLFRFWYVLFSYSSYLLRLRRRISHLHPDLIHANIPKSHISILLLVRLGLRTKTYLHIREIFQKNSCAYILYNLLFSKTYCHIIAISYSVKQNLPKRLRNHTTVIHNGVTIKPLSKVYGTGTSLRLLYLGRIVPWKGCHYLIELVSLLRRQYPFKKISLTLVGDTLYWSQNYRNQLLEKIQKEDMSTFCHLLPYTEYPENVYLTHDIFCNASYNEPFGRVIAEAQSFGLPIVGFNSGGISEIVENQVSGILVPYGDMHSLEQAIGQFIQFPNLINSMGKRGYDRTRVYFSSKNQNEKLCSHLRKGIGRATTLQNIVI